MFTSSRLAQQLDPEYGSAVAELLQSTSRLLITATAVIYFVFLGATVVWPVQLALNTWLIAPASIVLLLVALWLLPRSYLAAHLLWQVTMAASITLAVYLFQQADLAAFYILLPMTASVCLGWRAGLAAQILISLLMVWLSSELAQPPTAALQIAVMAGGAIAGVLGWASTRAVLTTTAWSLDSYRAARRSLEDARDHRAQLAQAVKELDAAYMRLERLNQMLNQARAEAEETKDARNRFSLAISHELRTPLNFIIGFSEIMMKTPAIYAPLQRWPPGLYDDIQEIYKSCKHLMQLVNDVLDLGQIDNLRMDLLKEWISIAQIVEEVWDMMQRGFDLKGIALLTEIESDLPPVYVDRTRIRQVILNLVNNSLRYTDKGATTIRVQAQENELLVCVADTGTGIAEADIPRVFEEFQQVNKDSWRRREGAGLGIPISKRFVELHGGRMWVESELDKGASFYFTLPLLAGMVRTVTRRSESDAQYWQAVTGQPKDLKNVLVVSTDPAAGEILAPYIEGCALTTVTVLSDIATQVREWLPEALLLDSAAEQQYNLGAIMDELPYDLPVISFQLPGSAAADKNLPSSIRQQLVKPFSNQALVDAIGALGPEVHRLLVVDDDPAMVNLITRVLASQESDQARQVYQLMAAGEENASKLLAMEAPDALLLDVTSPDIGDLPILQQAQKQGTPVILITALDWGEVSAGGSRQALRLQMRRPLSRHELSSVLKTLLATIHPRLPAKFASQGPAQRRSKRQVAADGLGSRADARGQQASSENH